MGPTARSLYPVIGLAAVGRTLADLGAPVKIGDGLEATLAALSHIDRVSAPAS
jgi:pyridoxamine--pyruvate transaminase